MAQEAGRREEVQEPVDAVRSETREIYNTVRFGRGSTRRALWLTSGLIY